MYLLRNRQGITKSVKSGFSWTYFFFGAFVPLFRGDFKWFFISAIAAMCTLGISHLLFIFKYNEWYLNDLLNQGYEII